MLAKILHTLMYFKEGHLSLYDYLVHEKIAILQHGTTYLLNYQRWWEEKMGNKDCLVQSVWNNTSPLLFIDKGNKKLFSEAGIKTPILTICAMNVVDS